MTELGHATFALPGLAMHALTLGDEQRPPVVLLHGFPELSLSWSEVMPILADAGFFVVAPDLRGYGRTDRPSGGYDLDTLAADIAALIETLGGRAHLVGHDWGGAIAYHVAAMHPERVDRLAVVNCPHPQAMIRGIWSTAQLRRSWYIFFFLIPWLPDHLISRRGGQFVIRAIKSASTDRSRLTPERLAPFAKGFSDRRAATAALAYYRQIVRGLLRPSALRRRREYPRIAAPFRLVWGEDDVGLGFELNRELQCYFTRPIDVCRLPGVGHFGPLEAPDRIGAALRDHLAAT